MSRYDNMVADALARVKEIMPWDMGKHLAAGNTVDGDSAEGRLAPHLRPEQRKPKTS